MTRLRLNWQAKAILPVALVLINGLVLFFAATLPFEANLRKAVIFIAMVGAVVVCGVMVMVLATVVQNPLVELSEKIARVRQGELDVYVNFARRQDQIGQLGRDFNAMVRDLRESRQEISRLHRTQMSRAEHLATLGEFAAGLAHEIRNPLAGIAGVMEVMRRDLPPTSPAREVLDDMRKEVVRINRIISDLLHCARPTAPEFRLSDLNTTAEHAWNFARQQATTKPIQFDLRKCDTLALVEHDTSRMHQVLLNLLLNAMQAIEGAGRIEVEVGSDNGTATIAVRDSGRGIAPEYLTYLYRPFFTTKGHGTGLGLSLVRRIVEDHGGTISVESEVGRGTSFTIHLPFRRAAVHAVAS